MSNNSSEKIYQGTKVEAIYSETPVTSHRSNPFIEALPPVMTETEAVMELKHFPDYDESVRHKDKSVRYQELRAGLRFFKPLNHHIKLERDFSCAIRASYLDRNPVKDRYLLDVEKKVEKFSSGWANQYKIKAPYVSTNAPGFNFAGISGSGKSQSIQNILGTYPQVIYHSNYKGQELIESQLVWLKTDCPFDGSLKGLCFNFFKTVDSIMGTNYLQNYARGRVAVNQMVPSIATVAGNHHMGVWVIDEIQRLNSAHSGGDRDMLNFFVELVNTLGIAVVLVGTYASLELFKGSFSQMRRGCGQGDLVWDRMMFDNKWKSFVKSLWKYQYTHETVSLKDHPELSKVLYDECYGITDLAIKAYMLAQERAIETNKTLNADIIRSAARDNFKIIRPALDAFKNNDKGAIKTFEDAYPSFLEKFINPDPSSGYVPNVTIEGAVASEPEIQQALNNSKAGSPADNLNEVKKSPRKSKGKKNSVQSVLPSLVAPADGNAPKTAYDALNDAAHITPDDIFAHSNGGGNK